MTTTGPGRAGIAWWDPEPLSRAAAFKEHQEEFEDIKLEVKKDKKDKDKAEVVMVGGTAGAKAIWVRREKTKPLTAC